MLTLQLVWENIKKYWQILVTAAVFIAGYFLFKSRTQTLTDVLNETKKRHDEEINAIKKGYEKQIDDDKVAYEKLQATLAQIEKRYTEAQLELDRAKRAEVIKIIQESKDDPNELAKRLHESTGFTIVVDQ